MQNLQNLFDLGPQIPGYKLAGAEPTLRQLVFKYYSTRFDEEKSLEFAQEYIEQFFKQYKEILIMEFNPKPGDKIICNNGAEYICCALETLVSEGFNPYFKNKSDSAVFGTKEDYSGWMYWYNGGYPNDPEWNIREVIPQISEALTDDKKEEVKEEPRYTVEEVTEAFANTLHLVWMGGRKEGIEKVKDYLEKKSNKEYQEYLRLKAIYE